MAILFEWYENPVAPHQSQKTKLHARIILNGKIGTDELRARIQERSSLTKTDVSAVLDALCDVMGEELREGRQVHLDGIGYFYPSLKCKEEITPDTPRKNAKVELKAIQFRSDQKLKNSIGPVEIQHSKYARHSRKLSEMEIDIRLKDYFCENKVLTRRNFQSLCHMTRTTAADRLKRLREEGKLKNIGLMTQPIYVPSPGYYGVSRDEGSE